MTDNTYKKQLEKFGIESVVIADTDAKKIQISAQLESTKSVVKALMDNVDGRQWLYNKLDAYGVFTAPIVPNDPYGTHVLAGIQSAGHAILSDIMNFSSDNLSLMLQEAAARKQNYS